MKRQTFFSTIPDADLLSALSDLEQFDSTAIVPAGGVLAKARDAYVGEYAEHGLSIMQEELLYECARRWRNLIANGNQE